MGGSSKPRTGNEGNDKESMSVLVKNIQGNPQRKGFHNQGYSQSIQIAYFGRFPFISQIRESSIP